MLLGLLQYFKFKEKNLLDLGELMKGAYYTMDDAYKIANFDKVKEKCRMLEGNNFELTQKIKKLKKEHEKEVMELKKRK